jgi:hypothetical protein
VLNCRNFDVRRECLYREYFYLLPAEIVGINDGCNLEEVQDHLSELNSILKTFEVHACLLYHICLFIVCYTLQNNWTSFMNCN